jgi:hypothetical protein
MLNRKVIGHPGKYSEAEPQLLAYKSSGFSEHALIGFQGLM